MTHGLQEPHGEVEACVQMIDVGPWISQKCASEICEAQVSLVSGSVSRVASEGRGAAQRRRRHGFERPQARGNLP